jgi:hypothetical protein
MPGRPNTWQSDRQKKWKKTAEVNSIGARPSLPGAHMALTARVARVLAWRRAPSTSCVIHRACGKPLSLAREPLVSVGAERTAQRVRSGRRGWCNGCGTCAQRRDGCCPGQGRRNRASLAKHHIISSHMILYDALRHRRRPLRHDAATATGNQPYNRRSRPRKKRCKADFEPDNLLERLIHETGACLCRGRPRPLAPEAIMRPGARGRLRWTWRPLPRDTGTRYLEYTCNMLSYQMIAYVMV